jgi:hypothetical protein
MVAGVRLQAGYAHRGKVVIVAIGDSQFRIPHATTQLSVHPRTIIKEVTRRSRERPGAGFDPYGGGTWASCDREHPTSAVRRILPGAPYPDLDRVAWIPSDDADVFRLNFTSGREPRILKMATHGIRAVWRELRAFPAMRRLGIAEVLEFEHTSDDLRIHRSCVRDV